MKALLCVGISASGKTTFTEEFVKQRPWFVNINRDDIRFERLCNGERGWGKYKFNRKNEAKVSEFVSEKLAYAVHNEKSVVISDTNLNPKHREALINRLEEYGYEVEIKTFPVTLEEAWKRDAQRVNGVGQAVIYRQWQQWNEYIDRAKYLPSSDLPKCVIVDVDGTVAKMEGRGPFDWSRVDQDLPIHEVMDIVDGLHHQGYKIIFLSGRDGVCYEDTKQWLQNYFSFDILLYTRTEGDMRKDTVIKEELFWEHIADDHDVAMAIDDRSCMLRLWLDLGIKTISVGNPYVEF